MYYPSTHRNTPYANEEDRKKAILEAKKKWYQKNKERSKAYGKIYYQKKKLSRQSTQALAPTKYNVPLLNTKLTQHKPKTKPKPKPTHAQKPYSLPQVSISSSRVTISTPRSPSKNNIRRN